MFAGFAIAIPLLILLMYGLASVSIKTFELSKYQVADYILENEAQYLMERVTQEARVAKKIYITPLTKDIDELKIVYHTGGRDDKNQLSIADVWETRIFRPHFLWGVCVNINAKRQDKGGDSNPITGGIPADGENFISFGDTKINCFKFKKDGKLLHITLEMESVEKIKDTNKKIRLNTAVFMPNCEN